MFGFLKSLGEVIIGVFEGVQPFAVAALLLFLILSVLIFSHLYEKAVAEFEENYLMYFNRMLEKAKKRRRRKAYWRLLKYRISSRRKVKHDRLKSSEFEEGSYLWNFTYKK